MRPDMVYCVKCGCTHEPGSHLTARKAAAVAVYEKALAAVKVVEPTLPDAVQRQAVVDAMRESGGGMFNHGPVEKIEPAAPVVGSYTVPPLSAGSYSIVAVKVSRAMKRDAVVAANPDTSTSYGPDPWADCPHCAERRKRAAAAQKKHRGKLKRNT